MISFQNLDNIYFFQHLIKALFCKFSKFSKFGKFWKFWKFRKFCNFWKFWIFRKALEFEKSWIFLGGGGEMGPLMAPVLILQQRQKASTEIISFLALLVLVLCWIFILHLWSATCVTYNLINIKGKIKVQ